MENNIKVSPSHELLEELKTAVFNCDIEAVEAALRKGAKPNLPYNHQGWTPFLRACRAFYEPEVIKLFLEHGANINGKNKDGETPLHIMAQHRANYDCLELLIDAGANPDAQDNNGWTPLMKAVCHPQTMMRKDLIRNLAENSDTSIKNYAGKTAYDLAKENQAFNDETLLLFLKPVEDLTEDEFHKIFSTYMGGNNE